MFLDTSSVDINDAILSSSVSKGIYVHKTMKIIHFQPRL